LLHDNDLFDLLEKYVIGLSTVFGRYYKMDKNKQQEEDSEDVTSVGHSKGGKLVFMVVGAIAISILFYFMFFSDGDKTENVENKDELVIGSGGQAVTGSQRVNFNPILDNLEVAPTLDNNILDSSGKVEVAIPDVPAVPEISEDLKKQLVSNITPPPQQPFAAEQAQGSATKEPTYTKEEVDNMIQDKIREALEQQMETFSSNVGASATQQQEQQSAQTTPKRRVPNQNKVVVDPDTGETYEVEGESEEDEDMDAELDSKKPKVPTRRKSGSASEDDDTPVELNPDGTEKTEEQMLAEQAEREAAELSRIAKNRAMQERKTAPMFKVQSGTGPVKEIDTNEDSIILTFVDGAKMDIQSKQPDVTPQQIQDLSNVIAQGKVIAAVLETAIDTDTQTNVRAVVTKDVFAEEGKNILIPRGSRVMGTYETSVATGQTRVTINWNRILRVDGMALNISSIGADRLGRAGVPGELDNKYAQRLANSFLSSVLSVGTALAAEKISGSSGITSSLSSITGDTTTVSGKASDYAIVDATKAFMKEAQDIVDGIAKQKPVIRIPQGQRLTIMVTQDVTLPVYKRGI
jgi:type IV secretory pathway VirB10-like protein